MATADTESTAEEVSGTSSSNRLINEHEAAARLAVAVATLRRWRWARRGPRWVKVGAAVRYSLGDLAAFIEAGRQDPNPNA
jgi:hypothetical protein